MTKNPDHKGKIPWTMAVRNFGEAAARQLVAKGQVAPDPKEKDYGEVQPYMDQARASVSALNKKMNENGLGGSLRVSYIAPKDQPIPDEEVDDLDDTDGEE